MSKPYVMPSLGAGMEAGTVVEWHVEPGQRVSRGDVVGLVDTEKGAIEVEIWEDAEVEEIVAPPGTKVPVGEPLLLLKEVEVAETSAEPPQEEIMAEVWDEPEAAPASAEAATPIEAATPAEVPAPTAESPRRIRVSPVARKKAEALGIDPETIPGSGPGGAVNLADVEAAARNQGSEVGAEATVKDFHEDAPPPSPAPSPEPDPHPGQDRHAAMRKAIAAAMTRSKREIPHYYLAHTISIEATLEWLRSVNQDRPPASRLLLATLYLKAVATAVTDFPEFNGFWENDAFRRAEGVHPGVAISLRGGGLVAPAIHNADILSLDEITAAIRDVVQRSRSGHLRGSEVTDPTITVTSLGDRGVDVVFGIVYPPQVAIVGIGTVVERPWAEGGMVGSRRTVTLTLAGDHRASDGHRGGLFLEAIARRLQSPEDL